MMVTIVVAAILAGAVASSITPMLRERQLRDASEKLEQVLRRAQQLALTRNRTTFVQFDNDNARGVVATLVVGDPCQPDQAANPLRDVPANAGDPDSNGRYALATVEPTGAGITASANTFNYGLCSVATNSAPTGSEDLAAGTPRPRIVAFDNLGRIRLAAAPNQGVGGCLTLTNAPAQVGVAYAVCVLTELGDVISYRL